MGPCSSKSEKKKGQQIKIGGGEDGTCTWIKQKDQDVPNPITNSGWEMKFQVDDKGNISGGNKNDNEENALKKLYSGTLLNGKLDAKAQFEDGAEIKYEGQVEGEQQNQMKVTCTVIKGSSAFHLGDVARCSGTIQYPRD